MLDKSIINSSNIRILGRCSTERNEEVKYSQTQINVECQTSTKKPDYTIATEDSEKPEKILVIFMSAIDKINKRATSVPQIVLQLKKSPEEMKKRNIQKHKLMKDTAHQSGSQIKHEGSLFTPYIATLTPVMTDYHGNSSVVALNWDHFVQRQHGLRKYAKAIAQMSAPICLARARWRMTESARYKDTKHDNHLSSSTSLYFFFLFLSLSFEKLGLERGPANAKRAGPPN